MRRRLALAPLFVCLVAPGVAEGAPSPKKLAKRLVTAQSLEKAVAATEDVLVAGGVGIVRNGRVARRANKPAPIAASGTEVVHLALEAMEKRTSGRITLAELAARLRALRFPFAKPKRAPVSLKKFLKVWVRTARKRLRDPRTFTPRFLAEMGKRQDRPVDLAKGDYDPKLLRLTQLEVELIVAALQRGPRRLWTSSRKGKVSARVAQGENTPCSDYRKFQKEQLEELFGKGVANDLDALLDHGFKMLAGDISKNVGLEKGVALGIEQAILTDRGARRPGQRAKKLSAKRAGQAMAALNILLKVQKLATLYGSVGMTVFAEGDPELEAKDKPETVHKPYRNKQKRAFTALAGIDEQKAQDYRAEKDKLAKESDLMKAMRDCLKLLDLPSFTNAGDLAEEMEKWRVRWSFSMLNSVAEQNIRDTKWDTKPPTQNLRKLNDYQATAGPAYVNIKPEDDNDHKGCQPGIRQAYVTATAELDTSQGPGIGTAIDVATGNITGVAIEAAEQMFRSLVRPSGTRTMTVEYHIPDKATASVSQDVCRAFPPKWTGSASGEFTKGDGITTSWTATFTEFLHDQDREFALYNNWQNDDPARPVGSISWTMGGTDEQGCTVSGGGTTGIGVQLSLQAYEGYSNYGDRIAMHPGGSGGWSRDCPGPDASHREFSGYPEGPWICSPKGPYHGETKLSGSDPAVDEFFYDRRVTGTCTWSLEAG